jgi:predicted nucleic acid-binding protein
MPSLARTCTIGHVEIVADASALLAVVLDEPERGSIIDATVGATLISPMALPFEIGNALVALRKRGKLSEDAVLPAWEATQRIPVQLVPVQIEAALALALAHGIYAYDAYYLQCSLSRRRPLVTLDRKMREVAGILGLQLLV